MAAGSFWEMAVMVLNPPAGCQMQVMTHRFGDLPAANTWRSAANFELCTTAVDTILRCQ